MSGAGSEAALERAVADSIARAKAAGRTRLLAWVESEVDVESVGHGIRPEAWDGVGDRFLWERVDAGTLYFAWGSLEELEGEGADRFAAMRTWRRDIAARLDWAGSPRAADRALLFGGFGFDAKASADPDWKAFPAARFVLPEGIVERIAGQRTSTVFARVEPSASVAHVAAELIRRRTRARAAIAAPPRASAAAVTAAIPNAPAEAGTPGTGPDFEAAAAEQGPEYSVRSDRSHARFRAQVRAALGEIARGRIAKLVLARSLAVSHDADFDVPGFLDRLRALYPSCTLVAVGRGRDTFLAATPETLVCVAGTALETAALAGSAPRGRTPEEDADLGAALLASAKERAEHAHVVDAIRAVLAPRCAVLEIPAAPTLRALFGIQHLETAIRGTLFAGAIEHDGEPTDILALVEALHPTPAVAGAPPAAAAAWLRQHEGLERGWYAAPIGWLDAEGGGDFSVGLRSALIRNGLAPSGRSGASRARLFAGVGLVEGSEPERELVETRIKLRALLAPLTEI